MLKTANEADSTTEQALERIFRDQFFQPTDVAVVDSRKNKHVAELPGSRSVIAEDVLETKINLTRELFP